MLNILILLPLVNQSCTSYLNPPELENPKVNYAHIPTVGEALRLLKSCQTLNLEGIDHTRSKANSPQTNGSCDRFH